MINNNAFGIRKDGSPYTQCFCKTPELIENYELAVADKIQTWVCHHRLEIMPFSKKECSRKYLIELGLYYNTQPEALIFLPVSEHKKIHGHYQGLRNTGRVHTNEEKLRMSKALKGKASWNKGKKWENYKDRGKHWYTNGIDNIRCFECPIGYHRGRTIQKI